MMLEDDWIYLDKGVDGFDGLDVTLDWERM